MNSETYNRFHRAILAANRLCELDYIQERLYARTDARKPAERNTRLQVEQEITNKALEIQKTEPPFT